MDSEQRLRTEFRHALDDMLPPAPWLEAAVVEELRKRSAHHSTSSRQARSLRRWLAPPRPAMRLLAAGLIVVIAAVAVATFIELHGVAPRSAPAGVGSVSAYQALINRDSQLLPQPDGSCTTLKSQCPSPGKPFQTALQRWLDDLNQSEPPARFALIDSLLRVHLAANISDLNALYAAYQRQDQAGLDRAYSAGDAEDLWIRGVAGGIVDSGQEILAVYVTAVQGGKQSLASCDGCTQLASVGSLPCTGIADGTCLAYVSDAMSTVGSFEGALVHFAAPGALAARDAALQRDLATADTSIVEMSGAQITLNKATFYAGEALLQQVLPAINSDIAAILGG